MSKTPTAVTKTRSLRCCNLAIILCSAASCCLVYFKLNLNVNATHSISASARLILNDAMEPEKYRTQEGARSYHLTSSNLEDLVQMASSIAKEKGVVLFTVINAGYVDFAFRWLCNTAVLESVHQHVLFLATDISTGQRLHKQWPTVHVVSMNDTQRSGAVSFGTAGYLRIIVQRTRLIQRLLQSNVRLLLFEVDFVWLANPLPTILSQSEKMHSDIVATKVYGRNLACGCFLLLNPTPATKMLWTQLTEKMGILNKRIAERDRTVRKAENDQTYLSSLINEGYGGIRLSYLSERLFPDGKWYKLSHLRSRKPDPLVIHNNWVAGNDNKTEQAKKFGHWFLINSTDSESVCNMTLVRQLVSNSP